MLEVKIKADNYGQAIVLLMLKGGGFRTRHERTLIVNSEQRRILQEAGFVEANGSTLKPRKGRGQKAK